MVLDLARHRGEYRETHGYRLRLAKKLMGWEPKVKLDEGLQLTLDYFKNFEK
jgi:nucleoside-diphosphate-sugar epimerase